MDLHRIFHRHDDLDDLPALSEEEWSPIAAALRAWPARLAPRDFRLSYEQAEHLRRHTWRERLALPAPLVPGLAAVLVLILLAPSLLSGLGSVGAAPPVTSAPFFAPFQGSDQSAAGQDFLEASPLSPDTATSLGAKSVPICPPATAIPGSLAQASSSPTPSPSPTAFPPLSGGILSGTPNPAPSCRPGP